MDRGLKQSPTPDTKTIFITLSVLVTVLAIAALVLSSLAVASDEKTNLGIGTNNAEQLEITSSSGDSAVLIPATEKTAGLMSAEDKVMLSSGSGIGTDIGIGAISTDSLALTSSTGTGTDIPLATTLSAGIISASDKAKIDSAVGTDLSLGATSAVSLEIQSSSGTSVFLPVASSSVAGLISAADQSKLDAAVGTNLSISGKTGIKLDLISSTGTGTSLTEATTLEAGLLNATDKQTLSLLSVSGGGINMSSDLRILGTDPVFVVKDTDNLGDTSDQIITFTDQVDTEVANISHSGTTELKMENVMTSGTIKLENTSGSLTITNTGDGTFTGQVNSTMLELEQQGVTPSNPPVGKNSLYFKGNNRPYYLTSGGLEVNVPSNAPSSSGLLNGGIITISSPTTFDISDGNGILTDATTYPIPSVDVFWSGLTGIGVTNIASTEVTFIAVSSTGTVIQSSTIFPQETDNTQFNIGYIYHPNNVDIDSVENNQTPAYTPIQQLSELANSIGFINRSGNVFSAESNNLNITHSSGAFFAFGSNYNVDKLRPHIRDTATYLSSVTSFDYIFQDGTAIEDQNDIIPGFIDNETEPGSPIGNNRWSTQRIYITLSGNVSIQMGQADYRNADEAETALPTEAFVTPNILTAFGMLRGFLIVKGDASDLSDTGQAIFLSAGKFGSGASGSSGGVGFTTLQSAYDDSSVKPQILTDSTRTSLQIQQGSGSDTDPVLSILNGIGTNTWNVNGAGLVTSHSVGFCQSFGGDSPDSTNADFFLLNGKGTDTQSGASNSNTIWITPFDGKITAITFTKAITGQSAVDIEIAGTPTLATLNGTSGSTSTDISVTAGQTIQIRQNAASTLVIPGNSTYNLFFTSLV